jgi:hypothetical protein
MNRVDGNDKISIDAGVSCGKYTGDTGHVRQGKHGHMRHVAHKAGMRLRNRTNDATAAQILAQILPIMTQN